MQESQVQDLCSRGEVEDRCSPRDHSNTPDTSHTEHTLRAVEEAVDARVSQVFRWWVEEEVATKPSELAERIVDASSSPKMEGDHANTKNESEHCEVVEPIWRKSVHLPRRSQETGMAHRHAEMVSVIRIVVSRISFKIARSSSGKEASSSFVKP